MTMTEEVGAMLQKGLSEWWSEETEYVFQRIERWAAYARGYNRLRSQRLSRGCMTMQGKQEPRWSIPSNKLIIDSSSWNPRFHTLKKSRRKSRPEESKINCCGTFNYQSNSKLDSSCLETYRYDHSIYFKTIGDIKNSKKDNSKAKNEQDDRISISSEELVEWDVNSISDFIANTLLEDEFTEDNIKNIFNSSESSDQGNSDSDFVNVNLPKLSLNENDITDTIIQLQDGENNVTISEDPMENNNKHTQIDEFAMNINWKDQTQLNCVLKDENNKEEPVNLEGTKRFPDIWKTRRTTRTSYSSAKQQRMKQAPIAGDNDVLWPSVLLNYTKNIDPSCSPHHFCNSQS